MLIVLPHRSLTVQPIPRLIVNLQDFISINPGEMHMTVVTHRDTLEFGIAEKIWRDGTDKEEQLRALFFYKLACEKNDARAFLALYKINSEWRYSYLITGRQFNGEAYLNTALKLGHPSAFLHAGCSDKFYPYTKLMYLSIGMSLALKSSDGIYDVIQERFISQSATFAKEFLPEILKRGQDWTLGSSLDLSDSDLDETLIQHPNKFRPHEITASDKWLVFEKSESIIVYLHNLPGYRDYLLAGQAEDNGDLGLWRLKLNNASKLGNGQASYALSADRSIDLLVQCAENGSPDAFNDLFQKLIPKNNLLGFRNTFLVPHQKHLETIALLDCLIYLYTIMERLGIEFYADYEIAADRLSLNTDSGYRDDYANLSELKYQLCDHLHISDINRRAECWGLGQRFDSKFLSDLKIVAIN